MTPKSLLIFFLGIYCVISNVQAQLESALVGEDLSSSIQHILAQARRLQIRDNYEDPENEEPENIYSASNRKGHRQPSNSHDGQQSNSEPEEDLTSVLGIDKKKLYQDFMRLHEDIGSADDGQTYPSESYDY